MNYIDILNTDYYKEIYAKIEELKKDFPVNHGFIHINNVIENSKRLAITFNLNNKQTELLLIAATLHDIGYLFGKDDHAYNGGIYSKELLETWEFSKEDIEIISNAISNHGGKTKEEYEEIISMCLICADKLDFINTRYDITKLKEEYLSTFPYISDTYLDYKNNQIVLNINVSKNFDVKIFEISSYYNKLEKFLNLLSERLNASYTIKFNIK